jgi:prevent-host-death family protein
MQATPRIVHTIVLRSVTMKFATVRELRNRSGEVWKRLASDEVVITSNGKPVALLTRVSEDDLETVLRQVRLARFAASTRGIREDALRSGASLLSDEEIASEIESDRRENRG